MKKKELREAIWQGLWNHDWPENGEQRIIHYFSQELEEPSKEISSFKQSVVEL